MNELTRLKDAATRLKSDDVLQLAFDRARADALESLSKADPNDFTVIVGWQQRIAAIDDIRRTLDTMILQGPIALRAVR